MIARRLVALASHFAVPSESQTFEFSKDVGFGAGYHPGLIKIVDAHEPFSVVGFSIQIARKGDDDGTEVERTGG